MLAFDRNRSSIEKKITWNSFDKDWGKNVKWRVGKVIYREWIVQNDNQNMQPFIHSSQLSG